MLRLHRRRGAESNLLGRAYDSLRREIIAGQGEVRITALRTHGFTHFRGRDGKLHPFDDLLAEFAGELVPVILAAETPRDAAIRFHNWLRLQAKLSRVDPNNIGLWNPITSAAKGYGRFWCVPWEQGPHDWPRISKGITLTASLTRRYHEKGPFPKGLIGKSWFAEGYNSWLLTFIKQG